MCVFSSALHVLLLNMGPAYLSMSQSSTIASVYTHVGLALPSFLPDRGLRLARTGGPIKLTLWVLGLLARSKGKDLFHCCVNHCFISTLLSPSLCSDISQGFWPPFKCEHNTAIEIMTRTSWSEPGPALALAPVANNSCSKTRHIDIFLFFHVLDFLFCLRMRHTTPSPCFHPNSHSGGPQCAGNGSYLTTSTQRPIYLTFN